MVSLSELSLTNISVNVSTLSNPSKEYNGIIFSTDNKRVFIAISLFQIITGSLFNGLVLLLFFLNVHLLQIPSNLILLSLALSDFVACSLFVPYHLHVALTSILYDHSDYLALSAFSIFVNMNGAVIMTVDRFLAILYPMRYNTLVTSFRTRCILLFSWCIASLFFTVILCTRLFDFVGFRYFLTGFNVTCTLAIFSLYGAILRSARQQLRKIAALEPDTQKARIVMLKGTLKSAKTSGTIVFFFLASYLPLLVSSIMRSLSVSVWKETLVWSLSSAFWNSCVNPLLYCAFSKKLRAITRGTFRRLVK